MQSNSQFNRIYTSRGQCPPRLFSSCEHSNTTFSSTGHHQPVFNRVLHGDNKGNLAFSSLGESPDRTYSLSLTDIDKDGDLDVIGGNDSPDRKLIYKNDSEAKFALAGSLGEVSWTRHVTFADLNGDGYPDVSSRRKCRLQPSPPNSLPMLDVPE